MSDYVPAYSKRGRLSYIPQHRYSLYDVPSGLFQSRCRRPHRIHILHVSPNYDWTKQPLLRSKRSRVLGKLAGTRENAKRFLRSVISAPPSATPSEASSTSSTRTSESEARPSSDTSGEGGHNMMMTETMRPSARPAISSPVATTVHRPSLLETVHRSTASATTGRTTTSNAPIPNEKPIASGNGISASISLAEPVLFLQGFEHNDFSSGNTAMLRGSLNLRVSKSAKIKAVTLKFKGKAVTKWPEGIPPRKVEFEESDTIMSHTWPFFNAQFPTAEAGPCADRIELRKEHTSNNSSLSIPKAFDGLEGHGRSSPMSSSLNLSSREQKKLSLQVNQSRSFGKGDAATNGPSVAQRGYRTFHPGDYIYNFELPLDCRLPESIDVELGSVKYELEAVVERAGAFKANLMGTKEVTLIRTPSESSLEQVEPIAISRNWEDQLHYDIVISGKSFPLGAQVPIAFKLTPLAKVQCHRIKVFVTENIEYFCNGKRVHRMEPTRKVQLFEKRADGPSSSTFPGSSMRVLAGGGVPFNQRDAAARGEEVPSTDTSNLLGNLEGEANIGPTEMEFNVQLPSCHNMREKEKLQKLHFDTTYQNIQVHHWIKIVMRLSKPDQNDPSRRRHFEISIDSPFHILSCRATQANTALPAYSSPELVTNGSQLFECGCPGAAPRQKSPTSYLPTLNALNGARQRSQENMQSPGLAQPQQAHLGGPSTHSVQRPIHLLRIPSFNPPAFDEEEPPPPLVTPPPQYDSIASPTSGLADYFSRLSDAYDDDGDEIRPTRSRVEVPLTPGARVARSMDIPRTWQAVTQATQ
ncbi:MAG: hypothetical protein M1821_000381 [Bathelium mastoideum]|nr:MAG: hypothetical protein M1821_000381 [Bathelium mastoideum]